MYIKKLFLDKEGNHTDFIFAQMELALSLGYMSIFSCLLSSITQELREKFLKEHGGQLLLNAIHEGSLEKTKRWLMQGLRLLLRLTL